MRNLRVLSDRQVAVPVGTSSPASQAPLSCALEGGKKHALLHPDGTLQCLAEDGRLLWDMPLSTGTATYVELVYVVELGALFVACLEGSIATVTVPAIDADGILSEEPMEEVIGTFDGGLCAATWSSDQSLLLIVTPQRRVTVMTSSRRHRTPNRPLGWRGQRRVPLLPSGQACASPPPGGPTRSSSRCACPARPPPAQRALVALPPLPLAPLEQ